MAEKKNRHIKAKLFGAGLFLSGAALFLNRLAKATEEESEIDAENKYLDQPAPETQFSFASKEPTFYEKYGKKAIDKTLSFFGLVLLAPVFAVISLAIEIDDPGPILFKQKRIGKDKHFFELHKFRSMKMSTPHDVPTHQLENPDQYITRVGKFLRKTSLDELPQIWDIFRGKMSIIGPRPSLWNQEDLINERDKYGANGVMPGLTGLAQINGRDELEIPDKAQLDGKYVESLREGNLEGFLTDAKCFIGTIKSVAAEEGVVEGGTGEMKKALRLGVPETDPVSEFGCDKHFDIALTAERKVLITGAGSYIGGSFKAYAQEHYPNLAIEELNVEDPSWRSADFSTYDTVYHIAGLAHSDIGNVSDEVKEKYYAVNTDLAIEVAKKARAEGIKQFIYMSSMIVYGDSAPYGKQKIITRDTMPCPANFYGDSKWQADKAIRAMQGDGFNVAVLRPPMIYGKGSKGNYPLLAKIAKAMPVFPDVKNERSMLYIENLCEFLCKLTLSGESGIYFPQNREFTNTSEMVKEISRVSGRSLAITGTLTPFVRLASFVPGKIKGLVNKAFGNLIYDQRLSAYSFDYRVADLADSIEATEGEDRPFVDSGNDSAYSKKPHILVVSQYFYPEQFRINDIACEWVKRGYKVTVLTGIPNYPMGKFYDGYDRKRRTRETWNGVNIIRIPLIARGNYSNKILNAVGMTANYFSFVKSGKIWVKSKEAAQLKPDLVFTFEVSPMTQAMIGVWYGQKYHLPTFLYVQDLWPENVETVTGIHSRAIIGPIDRMVDKIYRETGTIFATSPSFVRAIVNRKVPVNKEKVHYWPQYAEDFYRSMEPQYVEGIDSDDGCYKIAFTGNIGTAQGLDILPKAAAQLKDDNVKFIIVGDGRYQAEFERRIDDLGVRSMFTMIPRVPAERVPVILSACNAGFISFNKTPLWENTIPAKLQSYMACGKAIIASASGETKRVIEEAQCGVCTEIGNAEELAKGIRELMNMDGVKLGMNARMYLEEHFDKKKLMDEMDDFIKEC